MVSSRYSDRTHNPERAREQTEVRRERIAVLYEKANQRPGKLDGQDAGVKSKGQPVGSRSAAPTPRDKGQCA